MGWEPSVVKRMAAPSVAASVAVVAAVKVPPGVVVVSSGATVSMVYVSVTIGDGTPWFTAMNFRTVSAVMAMGSVY